MIHNWTFHSKPIWTEQLGPQQLGHRNTRIVDMCVTTTNSVICYASDLLQSDCICYLVYSAHFMTLLPVIMKYLYRYGIVDRNQQIVNVLSMTSLWDKRSCTMISMKCISLVIMVQTQQTVQDQRHITRKVLIGSPISVRAVLDISGTMQKHNSIILDLIQTHTLTCWDK